MELFVEILFFLGEFLLEFLFNIAFEGSAEVGAQKARKIRNKRYAARAAKTGDGDIAEEPDSISVSASIVIYAVMGIVYGGISLIILPNSFIKSQNGRLAYFLLAPVAAGIFMSMIGKLRARRGEDTVRLDYFTYAFLFAFCMAGIRYLYAQ